jgi:uncharacterized protein (DUF433 family)
MTIEILADAPPFRTDSDGTLRIGTSRLLLDLVIRAFQDGATAETIVQRYPSATLAEVYSIIAYYLRHPEAVDKYLAERERQAESVRQHIEVHQENLTEIRHRLLNRKTA